MPTTITHRQIEAFREVESINRYADLAEKTAVYPGQGQSVGIVYCGLKLAGSVGKINSQLGKALKEDSFGIDEEELRVDRAEKIHDLIGDSLWFIVNLCREINVDPVDIMADNLIRAHEKHIGEVGE